MKNFSLFIFLFAFLGSVQSQSAFLYEPSPDHPYGLPNPDAPKEIIDWAPLIGECECKSLARIDQNTWADTTTMTWRWKYIMNGWGVQDETLHENGNHAGSIRQFIADTAHWYVHYYSSSGPTTVLPAWEGNKMEDGKIILYKDQTAPNGMAGNYKITFSDITEEGFNWLGEWVDKAETFSYPTWRIWCKKVSHQSNEKEKAIILRNIKAFSDAFVKGDHKTLASSYTEDGKVFPGGRDIIEGYDGLEKFWTKGEGIKGVHHKITPKEIKFLGDYAYDYGYYEGAVKNEADGKESAFKGKYLIVWKKVDDDWKIYLDIWNRM